MRTFPPLSKEGLWTFPVSCIILVKWGQPVSENITFLKWLRQNESETNISKKEKLFPHMGWKPSAGYSAFGGKDIQSM